MVFGPDGPDPSDPIDQRLVQAVVKQAQDIGIERDRGRARAIASEVSKLLPRGRKARG